MTNRDMEYGLISVIISVVFLISALDLLENAYFNKGFSALVAFVLVAIGSYLIGKSSK
jgi:Flp pilus assembly pilin Flp